MNITEIIKGKNAPDDKLVFPVVPPTGIYGTVLP